MAKQKKTGKITVLIINEDTGNGVSQEEESPEAAARFASMISGKKITARSVCYCCDHGTKKFGLNFYWNDPDVRRSRTASRSRNKGNTFEREVADKLRKLGYTGCKTSRAESRLADANHIDIVDVDGKLPVDIQCKYQHPTPSYFGIREGCKSSRPFCVVWKKADNTGANSPGTIAMIDIDFFYHLLKIYYEHCFNMYTTCN